MTGRLFEELNNQQIVDFFRIELLKSPNDPAAVAARMLTRALESGSKDNMSCVIVQFCDGSDYNRPNEFVAGTYYDRYRNKSLLTCSCFSLFSSACFDRVFKFWQM